MTWQKDENQIINTVTVNYANGRYIATDAGSISTYGTRNMIINRPDISATAEATLMANQFIFYFKAPLELIKAKVLHDSLFSGTHYHVLNQKYTLTDATVDKTSQGPYTCIKHVLHYPSFIDELTFGMPYTTTQSLLSDITAALTWLNVNSFYNRASDIVRHSLDAEASTASTSYTKLKTITFSAGLSAWYRVKFDLKTSNGSYLAYGKVYKNGVAIGGEFSTYTTAYYTCTQNYGYFLEAGDTLELWVHAQAVGGATAYVQNFRICYDTGTVQASPSDGDTISPSTGNVVGPASSTDNAVSRYDSTTGKIIQDSVVTVADTTGAISIAGHLAITDPSASPAGKVLQDDGAWHTLAGGGNVTGPGSSTDNAIARFDGTGGTTIQNSVVTIDDTNGTIVINGHTAMMDPSASPTGKFLRDDGTWQTVSGSFDPANATTITPVTDDTYDLGASTPKTWRTLYLGSANQVRSASLVAFRNVAGSADQSISVKTCQMSYAASLLAGAYLMGVQNSDYVLIEGGTTVTNGGIVLGSGGDTNLYRSAANQLKTDDSFDAYDYDIGGTAIITNAKVLANVTCDTAIVTSGQFSLTRMPRGTAAYVIRGTGAGTDPAYAQLAFTDMATGRITLTQMTLGTSGYFLKGQGASDSVYAAITAADLPTVTVAKGGTNTTSFTQGQVVYASAATNLTGITNPTTIGQVLSCSNATAGSVAYAWATAGMGDVVGPAGATDHAIVRYNTATGKLVQDSLASVSDAGLLNAVSLNIGGTVVLNSSRVLQNVSGSVAQFTSGLLPIAQLEEGAEGAYIRGYGAGVAPAYSNIALVDLPAGTGFLKGGTAVATIYSGADDRELTNVGKATFALARDMTTSVVTNFGDGYNDLMHISNLVGGYYVYRCPIWFDLTSIPAGATILAATLSFYVVTTQFDDGAPQTGMSVCIPATGYPSRPAVSADMDRNRIGAAVATITSFTAGAYNDFTIPNANITPNAWNAYYLRMKGDVDNTSPGAANKTNRINAYLGTATLQTHRPRLVVTYIAASSPSYQSIIGGDLPAPAASVKGGVALPATPTGTFYKDDGTWGTPTAGAHTLTDTNNTVSGRTAGEVLKCTGATTYGFAKIAQADTSDLTSASSPTFAAITATSINASALPAPGASTKGGVALPASPTGTYYKDDGTWNTPGGTTIATPYEYFRRYGATRARHYTMPHAATDMTVSGALVNNRLYAIPFVCPKTVTADMISVYCTTSVGSGALRLGIYSDTNGEPGTLLLDAGTVDTSSTGLRYINISQSLTGGVLYWLAAIGNNATHQFRVPALASIFNVIGIDAAIGTSVVTYLYYAGSYGALPGTFPTPTNGTGIVFPAIYIRLSA
jgi:hypothetical protein